MALGLDKSDQRLNCSYYTESGPVVAIKGRGALFLTQTYDPISEQQKVWYGKCVATKLKQPR